MKKCKLFFAIAIMLLPTISIGATKTVVSSDRELSEVLQRDNSVDTIYIKSGSYDSFIIDVSKSGTPEKPLVITAERPGEVLFVDNTFIVLSGDYITLSNLYFQDGLDDRSNKPVIDILGDYNRVSNCAFWRCHNRAAVASTYKKDGDYVPKYTHIDHCYFADNFGWRCHLDLGAVVPSDDERYTLYYRVNDCYFSSPFRMGENTGTAMRIGLGDPGYGRCLIDNNVFERVNPEPELIENKSHENIYIGNTFTNCEAQVSFRQGRSTLFLHNYLVGSDKKSPSGGLAMWMNGAIVAGNYFSFPKGSYIPLQSDMTPREDRKPAAVVRFNCGYRDHIMPDGSYAPYFAAQDNIVINNVFDKCKDYLFDLSHIYYQLPRLTESISTTPFNNTITENKIIPLNKVRRAEDLVYFQVGDPLSDNSYRDNYILGYNKSRKRGGEHKYDSVAEKQEWMVTLPGNPQYNLCELVNSSLCDVDEKSGEVSFNREVATFDSVGPFWLINNPSRFAKDGYTPELVDEIRKRLKFEF